LARKGTTTDGTDVVQALVYVATVGSPDCLIAGDLNCDGHVTSQDVLRILGEISAASCPTPEPSLRPSLGRHPTPP
jgi:hypothetical protein